jgi:uncharacterized Zn finger protein (UPF0148 family)
MHFLIVKGKCICPNCGTKMEESEYPEKKKKKPKPKVIGIEDFNENKPLF